MRRFLFRLGLAAIVSSLAGASCLSPTLPLPPPDVESVSQSKVEGTWLVSGTCTPGALVTVLNDATGEGVVFEDRDQQGKWIVSFEAEQCDPGWVSQELGDEGSARTFFTVQAVSAGEPVDDTCQ